MPIWKSGGGSATPAASSFLIPNSGRVYCYSDFRWVTPSDDLYGSNQFQINESGGTGVDPEVEWEHMGLHIPAGYKIKGLHIQGRSTSSLLTDMEVYAVVRNPTPTSRWETGFGSDTQDSETILYRDSLFTPSEGTAFSGDTRDFRARSLPLSHEVNGSSILSVYLKPTGTYSGTVYFYCTYTWELEKIA